MPGTLYICYFGIREPLVQTQVLPYLRELMKGGYSRKKGTPASREPKDTALNVSILTFESKRSDEDKKAFLKIRGELAAEGIDWDWLPYHKRFSVAATAWDTLRGIVTIRRFIARKRPDILHGRVHIPTLIGALARKFSRHKPKLLFDIRGFFPEEYTDAGIWPEGGWLYRAAKSVERWLMREADGFVVLTENARNLLFPESKETGFDKFGRPVEVIPCCVDFARRFSGEPGKMRGTLRKELGIDGRFVLTHVGSLGGLYMTEQIADLLAAARAQDPEVFALFLTQSSSDLIIPLLRDRGFAESDYFVGKADPLRVQEFLSASDAAISFVKSGYATASRSPTKIPEYLACGLPIISNRGVGDVDLQIENNGVGVLLDRFDESGYRKALKGVAGLNGVANRCRETARREFDLNKVGGERYRRIYRALLD